MDLTLNVPNGAASATLFIRHTHSVQAGPQERRTITSAGIELCRLASLFYIGLVRQLEERFGTQAVYYASPFIRSELTLWEIFHPEVRPIIDERLGFKASLKDLQSGEFMKAHKGQSVHEIYADFVAIAGNDPAFKNDALRYLNFVQDTSVAVKVGCAHETSISNAARLFDLLPMEQLGLEECEGVIFFCSPDGHVIGAQKVAETNF